MADTEFFFLHVCKLKAWIKIECLVFNTAQCPLVNRLLHTKIISALLYRWSVASIIKARVGDEKVSTGK